MESGQAKRKVSKVLLFIPPAFTLAERVDVNPLPPLGLGYLAAVLEREGIEVRIVDTLMKGWDAIERIDERVIRIGLPFERIKAIIGEYGPDVVGVNNLFTKQRENAHMIYRAAKDVDSAIVTVAGGAHPTVMPELPLQDANLDYVVLGEGEESFLRLIRCLEGRGSLSDIDGIGWRSNGHITITPKKRYIEDLDSLPFPSHHLLDMEAYFGLKASHGERRHERFAPVVSSRGCVARCTFCTADKVWGRRFRYRSPENVVAELRLLKERYGVREVMFEDDNLTLNPGRAERIFDLMIRERLGLEWDTPNGIAVWTLNERLIDKMKESGCYKLNFAIESGSQYILDNVIRKPVRIDKVKPLVRHAQSIGLDVGMFLVIGMPGEKESHMWESFRLAEELGIYFPHISVATPYPGSPLFDLCRERGYLKEGFSLDDLYIRSFSIETEEWDAESLRGILGKGQRYLLLSYIRKQPFAFLRILLSKLLKDPAGIAARIKRLILERDWSRIR